MNSKKAQITIMTIIIAVLAIVIAIAFVPVIVSTVFEAQFQDAEFRLTGETVEYTNATAIGLSRNPLLLDTTDLNASNFIVSNSTDGTRINASTGGVDLSYEILFTANSTIIFHGITDTAQDFDFNYSVTQQNSTGLGTASILLLSLVTLIFVAFIVVLVIKKFIK